MGVELSSLSFSEIVLEQMAGFAGRLAYLRWIRSVGRPRQESDREFAKALGVGEKWLAKWKGSEKAPEGRTEAAAIERALGGLALVMWLYDGKGRPPRPELWEAWTSSDGLMPTDNVANRTPAAERARDRASRAKRNAK